MKRDLSFNGGGRNVERGKICWVPSFSLNKIQNLEKKNVISFDF